MTSTTIHSATTAIFSLMLAAIYAFEISEKWAYLGFLPLRSISAVLIATLVACGYALFLSKDRDFRNLSHVLTHYIFFVPGLILSATYISSISYVFLLILSYTLLLVFSRAPSRAIKVFRLSNANFVFIIMIFSLISTVLMVTYGGLNFFHLSILRVYDFRADSLEAMPSILIYLFFSVAKAVMPLALVFAIYFRSTKLATISTALIILMFGMLHQKSVLFLPFVAAALYLLARSDRVVTYIIYCFIGVISISAFELIISSIINSDSALIYTSLVIRRIFFIPPLIDNIYVNYFLDSPKIFWSSSRFGLGIVKNPYDLPAPLLIGLDAFGVEGISANTGIIGSGFSHAGNAGVVIYSIIFGFMISILNNYGKKIGHDIVFASSTSIVISILISSDFSTAILTHGLLLLLLLFAIFPRVVQRHEIVRGSI